LSGAGQPEANEAKEGECQSYQYRLDDALKLVQTKVTIWYCTADDLDLRQCHQWSNSEGLKPLAPGAIDPQRKCGSKSTCSEMKSCNEAKFYLNNCGATGLDGNGDGVPCNSLCKK
jgi:hypothetical protein